VHRWSASIRGAHRGAARTGAFKHDDVHLMFDFPLKLAEMFESACQLWAFLRLNASFHQIDRAGHHRADLGKSVQRPRRLIRQVDFV